MINPNFQKMPESYLFREIARRVSAYKGEGLIRMGIGDVTQALPKYITEAMCKAALELSEPETFRGYPPYEGYEFLRQNIADYYAHQGIVIDIDEIFVSDGAKSDTAGITDLFSQDIRIAVCDPVYPVYVDSNAIAGKAGDYNGSKWSRITYMSCCEENNFTPALPSDKVDLIYLCYPNNPTGVTLKKPQLQSWVDYANDCKAVILYDCAYEAYITESGVPHSIFECTGARSCAVEFRSFSKTAGFTGVRCGYTVIPRELKAGGVSVADLWMRRQSTKFNGVSYITQAGAAATLTERGRAEAQRNIDYYMENARLLLDGVKAAGLRAWGGVNAPYVWFKTPDGMPSWDYFDHLMNNARVVGTPGVGFGPAGEGYFRLTAFGTRENTLEAVKRIKSAR